MIRERIEERVRYDFSLALHRVVLQVEKKVILDAHGERRIISASTATIGPPRFSVTWEFMVNVVILVVLYALPMNRLARMLSSEEKRFSASALSKMIRFVAEHFAPIYLQLFDELADTARKVFVVIQKLECTEVPKLDTPMKSKKSFKAAEGQGPVQE